MRRQPTDQSLLSLNTMLQAIPGTVLTVEQRDDATITGMLEECDAYMK